MVEFDLKNMSEEEQQYVMAETGAKLDEREEKPDEAPVEEEAPPAEEAKADEPPKEEEAPAEEEPPHRRATPIDTIRELRADRRELRKELKAREDLVSKAQARLDALEQFRIKAEAPDADMDPEAHARYQEKIQTEQAEKTKLTESQQKQQEEYKSLYEHVSKQEQVFAAANPDYSEAILSAKNKAIENRAAELMVFDIPEERAFEVAAEQVENFLEAQAAYFKSNDGNFAKWAYKQAKELLGKETPQTSKTTRPEDKGAKDIKRAEDNLKALNNGKSASRTPRGGSGSQNLTVEELVAMDDEDFQKYASMSQLKKLMG